MLIFDNWPCLGSKNPSINHFVRLNQSTCALNFKEKESNYA